MLALFENVIICLCGEVNVRLCRVSTRSVKLKKVAFFDAHSFTVLSNCC